MYQCGSEKFSGYDIIRSNACLSVVASPLPNSNSIHRSLMKKVKSQKKRSYNYNSNADKRVWQSVIHNYKPNCQPKFFIPPFILNMNKMTYYQLQLDLGLNQINLLTRFIKSTIYCLIPLGLHWNQQWQEIYHPTPKPLGLDTLLLLPSLFCQPSHSLKHAKGKRTKRKKKMETNLVYTLI